MSQPPETSPPAPRPATSPPAPRPERSPPAPRPERSPPAPRDGAPGATLSRRAARGTLFGIAGMGANQALRLLGNVVLSRLLFPEAFGLMALANLLLAGLQMMSNVGIQPAIIRHPRGEERDFLDTAWTLQVLRGVLLWGVGILCALPLARFYGEPQLAAIVPAVTASAVLLGALSTRMAVQTRRIELGRVAAIDTLGSAVAVATMIAAAWLHRSVWALVVGGVAGAAAQLVASHTLLPGPRDRLRWEHSAAREIFGFGKWIFVSTLFTFLAMRIDVALLGKLLPMGTLGVYSIAVMLPGILGQVSARLIQTVLMPALSESYRAGEDRLRESFARARALLLPLGLLATLAVALLAPAFFVYLYDDRYHEAGWMAQLSLLAAWFTFLQEASGRVLLARGDSRTWALANAAKTFATALGCWLGFRAAGLPGLILGVAAGAACGHALVALRLAAAGVPTLARDVVWTLGGLALGALSVPGAAALASRLGLPDAPWARLALGAALLAPFAALLLLGAWRALRQGRGRALS